MTRVPRLASDLTSDVRLALFLPTSGGPISDAEILQVSDRLIRTDVWPRMNEARGKLLSAVWDIAMHAGSIFDEPSGYPLPPEGMATLESVSYVAPDGEEFPMSMRSEREWHRYGRNGQRDKRPLEYTVRGGQVHVFRHPSSVDTGARIRLHLVSRPLKLAAHSTPNLYLEIDQDPALSSTNVRLNVVDAGLLSSAWGTTPGTYDLIALASAPPHIPTDFYAAAHQDIQEGSDYIDVAVANWTRGSDLSAVPGRAANGDFIVANYTTPIVQLPDEAYSVLVHGVVMEFADARKDQDRYKRRKDMYEMGLGMLPDKLTPRVQNDPKTYINHDHATRLRLRGSRRGLRRGVDAS